MPDFIFATLLFTAYFCFTCCLLHNPKDEATTSNSVQGMTEASLTVTSIAQAVAQETQSATPLDDELEEDAKEEPAAAIEEETIEQQETEPAKVTVEEPALAVEPAKESQTSPTLEQLLEGINLDKLQLRPARKIASRLNIAQKVGGKDQPLGFLRAQIKKRLSEKPQEVALVIKEVERAS